MVCLSVCFLLSLFGQLYVEFCEFKDVVFTRDGVWDKNECMPTFSYVQSSCNKLGMCKTSCKRVPGISDSS